MSNKVKYGLKNVYYAPIIDQQRTPATAHIPGVPSPVGKKKKEGLPRREFC